MKSKYYYLTLDTETTTLPEFVNDSPLAYPLVYDLGGCVHDRYGNIVEKFSFVIKDIFCDKTTMASAYYFDKMPKYLDGLASGEWLPVSFAYARDYVLQLINDYKVRGVIAYNATFDRRALNNTSKHLGLNDYFFDKEIVWYDSMKAVQQTIAQQKKYNDYCVSNGYMTKHAIPRPQVKAEVVYRFISGVNDFIESHTALSDSEIETEIMAKCFSKHQKLDFKL